MIDGDGGVWVAGFGGIVWAPGLGGDFLFGITTQPRFGGIT